MMVGKPPADGKPLRKAQEALSSARRAHKRMLAAERFDEREHEWRSFLNFLAQVIEKLKKGYQGTGGKVEPWIGHQVTIRDDDPLLAYLFQARSADQHSVQDSVEAKPGSYEFRLSGPGPMYVEKLVVENGRVTEYRGTGKPEITITPARMEALPLINRGVKYDPPVLHLGRQIGTRDTAILADLGIRHYDGVLREFEKAFVVPKL